MKIKIYEYDKADELIEKGYIDFDMNEFGHELCMGIRHGLFGASASHSESINNGFMEIADSINNLAEAIREMKEK